jgi:type II secretion system protein G
MDKKGFTLIELLIVIAIIGIIVAIAIPNLLTALQKARQKSTMADMKSLGISIESYLVDWQMAPGNGGIGTVAGLHQYLVPYHNNNYLPTKDGWGGLFLYESGAIGPTQDFYSVISYGRSNVSTGIDIGRTNYTVNTLNDFDNDICFSNGTFTYGPKIR